MADPEIAEAYRNAPAAKTFIMRLSAACSNMWSRFSIHVT